MLTFITTLLMVQATIACVTLYLHRSQTHKSVIFHPVVAHAMRFWLWMTTGMNTREWVAIHRSHHQNSDTDRDPHSPAVYGIWHVLFMGWHLYVKARQDREMIERLSVGTPRDWIERHVYTPYPYFGLGLMLLIDVTAFGLVGLLVWGIQMIWIPFWAAGVINGIGHYWGYRNIYNGDSSRNIIPWAFWIGGEELHANHHDDGACPKFSQKWWEFDIGWFYITVLKSLGLAKVRTLIGQSCTTS